MMYKNGRKWVNLITLLITRKDNVAQNLLFMRVLGYAKLFESHAHRALADTDGANQNEQNAQPDAFQNHL